MFLISYLVLSVNITPIKPKGHTTKCLNSCTWLSPCNMSPKVTTQLNIVELNQGHMLVAICNVKYMLALYLLGVSRLAYFDVQDL